MDTRNNDDYVNRGFGDSEPYTDGMMSADGGATWTRSASHAAPGAWSINPTDGAGYRFGTAGGEMVLERADDLRAPTWRTVHAFSIDMDRYARVDVVGSTGLAVVGLRLWVSSDGGKTFAGPLGGGLPAVMGISSLDSADGTTIYATSRVAGLSFNRSALPLPASSATPPASPCRGARPDSTSIRLARRTRSSTRTAAIEACRPGAMRSS
ncbi:MAG: hypothetical protein IPG96_03790 [Proteobacteria bacterium]|nr:hypothetical protein [Pseudomonadota bacterium]